MPASGEPQTFGVSAVSAGGESDITTVLDCVGGEATVGDLTTPYNVAASGYCEDSNGDGVQMFLEFSGHGKMTTMKRPFVQMDQNQW